MIQLLLHPNALCRKLAVHKFTDAIRDNSNKTYPSYWEITPQATPINSYSVVMGNPALKPYRSYQGQLLYILKQKYTFMVFAQYEPDYFAQLPYQSSTELKNVFRYENMDYNLVAGVGAVIPFRPRIRTSCRTTGAYFRHHRHIMGRSDAGY